MSRRSLFLGILAWMAVVAVTSGVTWTVINAAGQQVLSTSDVPAQVQSQAEISQPTEATAPRPSKRPTPRPTPRPTRTPTRTTSAAPSSAYPSAPRTTAEAPTLPTPSSTRSTPASTPRPPERSAGPSSSSVQQQRTWQGAAGSVTVRCSGSRAALQSASPSDGYRIEVGSRGPGQVEVTFRSGVRQVQVRGVCVSGTPRFGTETDTRDD